MVKFRGKRILVMILATIINDAAALSLCANLFKESGNQTEKYSLADGSKVADFENANLTANITWNYTMSFDLYNGCKITVCNDTYFKGDCREFSTSLDKLPDGFDNILSAECSCQRAKTCATLFKKDGKQGEKYSMLDDSYIANFEDQYVTANSVWNSTLSFSLNKGCNITACNDAHFNGYCKKFSESLDKIPDEFGTILSASCWCEHTCSCSDIWMRGTSCARAYIGKGGCNVCNPIYTDLKGEKSFFQNQLQGKITAIKVREGCNLTVFDEEEFEGEETEVEDTFEPEDGKIGSYRCSCPKDGQLPKKRPPRPSDCNSTNLKSGTVGNQPTAWWYLDPVPLHVPNSIEKVSLMLKGRFKRHPGLLAALTSLKSKRSSKNVYILTVGSTGAGKSSAINMLFDNPNVTRVGGIKSTTTDIHEFRINIPIDELGIQNSELRVIDTPGLGDTGGIEHDAKFLATLDDYLTNHEELRDRIPNIILIFHKFTDNRFDGEGSPFVKMLKGLDAFRKRITDENYSNVIFVFSHFMSELLTTRERPKKRLQAFQDVIVEHTLFPKPIVMAVAENQAVEQGLLSVNGYFKLPNGDYYPRNLLEKIQSATSGGEDPIGNALITTAFRDSDGFNISSITHKMVSSNHTKVSKYYHLLARSTLNVENTEISEMLEDAFKKMDSKLKDPGSLFILQKALSMQNIRTTSDIPETTLGKLEILANLKINKAIEFLLENGLNLTAPIFNEEEVTGYSYNVFKDTPLHKTPFKLGERVNSDIGYLLPSAMTCNVKGQVSDTFKMLSTRAEYIDQRLTSLGIEGKIAESEFSGEIKTGFTIKSKSLNDRCEITAVREIRNFQLVLNDKPQLNPEFEASLRRLVPFNETDQDSVKIWNDFFDNYGTHVVQSAYGGGAIEIHLKSNRSCHTDIYKLIFDLVQFAEEMTLLSDNSTTLLERDGVQHWLNFRGGDPAYHSPDLTNMTLDDASRIWSNWKKSLRLTPTILTSEIKLIPISSLAKKMGQKQNISLAIQSATTLRFNSTLKYSPPKKSTENQPGPGREDTTGQKSSSFGKVLGGALNKEASPGPSTGGGGSSGGGGGGGGGCLKKGTLILMADKTSKPIERIKVGDLVLDHQLKPTKVIGLSYEFLMDKTFYGFDNESFFFTDSHVLAGPRPNKEIQLYAKDLKGLLVVNPMMEFMNLREMKTTKMSKMFVWEKFNSSLSSRSVSVFKDPVIYPADTLTYFFLVDSSSGTYFANGFVCHDEMPPFHIWPNTMGLLFYMFNNPSFFKLLEGVPYTLETSTRLANVVTEVRSNLEEILEFIEENFEQLKRNESKLTLDKDNIGLAITEIFGQPSIAKHVVFGIYSATSKIIADYLDTDPIFEQYVGGMQRKIANAMSQQITWSIKNHLHDLKNADSIPF